MPDPDAVQYFTPTFGKHNDNPSTFHDATYRRQQYLAGRPVAGANAEAERKRPQANALGYKANNAMVDAKKYPAHAAGQACKNCQLYQGVATDVMGSCPLYSGKQVAGAGWCSAYSKKV